MSKLPDFLVIGAARAGTTALHSYLRQHPQIFMPSIKEPNFFSFQDETLACKGPGADFINNSVTKLDKYRELFAPAPADTICGEASPLYLYTPNAPANIHRLLPTAKLVVILRNPIEQAYSHFLYATKQAIEPEADFTKALELEDQRLKAGWQPLFAYSKFPRYAEQLIQYFKLFPRDQFFIRSYEDFQEQPETLMRELFEFIGADSEFTPDMSQKMNAGGVPKNRALQDFLMKSNPITRAIGWVVPQNLRLAIRDRIAAVNMQAEQTMPPKARDILKQRLGGDIRELSELLKRDFRHWLR